MDLRNKVIVIFYMLYFGDMVSLSPFLSVLRRNAEGSRIILVIDSRFGESVAYNPNIDEIIPVDRKHMGIGGGSLEAWKGNRQEEAGHPFRPSWHDEDDGDGACDASEMLDGGSRNASRRIFHGQKASRRTKGLSRGGEIRACAS